MTPAFLLDIAKIVGNPADGFWSQVHAFLPKDEAKANCRGQLLAALVIKGVAAGVTAITVGREVLSRLHEEYYGNLAGSAFERLGQAVKKVSQETKDLEITAGVLLGKALYLAVYGFGEVVLKRGDQYGRVIKGEGEFKIASGLLKDEDVLVLGSGYFFQIVGRGVLKAALQGGRAIDAVESFAPLIAGRESAGGAVAVVAVVNQPETLAIELVSQKEVPPALEIKVAQPPKGLFVRPHGFEKKKKIYLFLSIFLLVIFAFSLVLGLKRKSAETKKERARLLLSQAEEKFNQGKLAAMEKPSEGQILAEEAKKLAGEAEALFKESEEPIFFRRKVEEFLDSLATEVALGQPTVFMDLTLITDGASGKDLALQGKDLYIFDQAKKKVYRLNLEKKSYEIINLGDKTGQRIALISGKPVVLGDEEVFGAEGKTKIEGSDNWGENIDLGSFGNNLYLLDSEKNSVWRYALSGESYGQGKNWFADESHALAQASSMAIDGSIWVSAKDSLFKFTLGKKDSFVFTKMPEEPENLARVFTSADHKNLYLLDKGRGKVYVVDKKGEFKAAYSWEGFRDADDLVAQEALKKIFILAEDKIYEVGLK